MTRPPAPFRALAAALALSAVVAAPADAQQVRRDEGRGYAVTVPAGWTVEAPDGFEVSFVKTVDGKLRAGCMLARGELAGLDELTPDQTREVLKARPMGDLQTKLLEGLGVDIRMARQRMGEHKGRPALITTAQFSRDRQHAESRGLIVANDEAVMLLLCLSFVPGEFELRREVEGVFESFEVF